MSGRPSARFLVERRAEIMQIVGTHLERLLGGPVSRDRVAAEPRPLAP
jgi:hypothetical protein